MIEHIFFSVTQDAQDNTFLFHSLLKNIKTSNMMILASCALNSYQAFLWCLFQESFWGFVHWDWDYVCLDWNQGGCQMRLTEASKSRFLGCCGLFKFTHRPLVLLFYSPMQIFSVLGLQDLCLWFWVSNVSATLLSCWHYQNVNMMFQTQKQTYLCFFNLIAYSSCPPNSLNTSSVSLILDPSALE